MPNPYIYICMELVSSGECFNYISMAAPPPVFAFGQKRPIVVLLLDKPLELTNLKLSMHAQLDFGSNMGWFPPGHTSFYCCVRLKMPKMELLNNAWTGVRPTNPDIFKMSVTKEHLYKPY